MTEDLHFKSTSWDFMARVWEAAASLPCEYTPLPLWEKGLPASAEEVSSLRMMVITFLCGPSSGGDVSARYVEQLVQQFVTRHSIHQYHVDPTFRESFSAVVHRWGVEHDELLRRASSDPVVLRVSLGRKPLEDEEMFRTAPGPEGEAQYLMPRPMAFEVLAGLGRSHRFVHVLEPVPLLVASREVLEIVLSLWEVGGEGLLASGEHVVEAARSLVNQ